MGDRGTYKKDGAVVLELSGASIDGNVLTMTTPGNTVMLVYKKQP